MGLVSSLAQCMLDFLVEESCHSCGSSIGDVPGRENAPPVLATPVDLHAWPGLRLATRLLCTTCARAVQWWHEPVVLTPPALRPGVATLVVFPALVTDERVLALIHLLKFGRRERLAPWIARAMASGVPERAREVCAAAPLLVPVPMDRVARTRRGFNQAESIARALGLLWDIPVSARALSKLRRTPPQSTLDRTQRLANLDGAFGADSALVQDRTVFLVDDLVTTGATAFACAAALRRSGASEVRVVCAGYHHGGTAPQPAASPFPQS
jgi:ComF family protein